MSGIPKNVLNRAVSYAISFIDHFEITLITYCFILQQVNDNGKPKAVSIARVSMKCPNTSLQKAGENLGKLVDKLYQTKRRTKSWTDDAFNCLCDLNRRDAAATPRRVLLETAAELFQSFEQMLMEADEEEIEQYATDAAERIIKYIVTGNVFDFDVKNMTSAVTHFEGNVNKSDKTKSSLTMDEKSIIQCCFGKLIFALLKIEAGCDKALLAEHYANAGLIHENKVYFNSSRTLTNRFPFGWESENIAKILEDYNENKCLQDNYKNILKPESCSEIVKKVAEKLKEREFAKMESKLQEKIEGIKQTVVSHLQRMALDMHFEVLEELVDSVEELEHIINKKEEDIEKEIRPASQASKVTNVNNNKMGTWNSNFY